MVKNIIIKTLKALDTFGENINFLIKENPKTKTVFGGFLSIINIFLGGLLFGYFSIDLFERKRPITRVSQELNSFSEIQLIDLPMPMVFNTEQGLPIRDIDSYITIYALIYQILNINGNITTLVYRTFIEKCDSLHFSKHLEFFGNTTKYAPLGTELCINPFKSVLIDDPQKFILTRSYMDISSASNSTLSFSNEFSQVPSTFINLRVYKCNEFFDKKKCVSEEQFKATAKEIYMSISTIDYYLDLQNLEKPNQKKLKVNTLKIGYEQPKKSYFRFKLNKIYTDDGFLFENNQNVITYAQYGDSYIDFFQNNDYFYEASFEVDSINNIYYRRYDKIQDVLARVGGIVKVLGIVGQIIYTYYSTYKFYFDMTNLLFDTPIEKHEIKNLELKEIPKVPNLSNRTAKDTTFQIIANNSNLGNNFLMNAPKRENLHLRFGDYLKSMICKNNSKYPKEFYDLSENAIKHNLDIMTYLKALRNVEQLIDIITNDEEEKTIFNYKQDLEKYSMRTNQFQHPKDNYEEIILQIKNKTKKNPELEINNNNSSFRK